MGRDTEKSLYSIEESIRVANNLYIDGCYHGREDDEYLEACEYYLDKAFVELLLLLERLEYIQAHDRLNSLYKKAKRNNAITKGKPVDGDPYLDHADTLRIYIASIASMENIDLASKKVPIKIIEIIRESIYPMNDTNVWPNKPSNENDVHVRTEAILKCVYHDLLSKPALSKPIKNFIPDTGIPSEKLLIEYKFISTMQQAKSIADEILADTRGYVSKEWNKFLFVIYETERVKSEKEWKQLIKNCGLSENTEIIVISGGSKTAKKKKPKAAE